VALLAAIGTLATAASGARRSRNGSMDPLNTIKQKVAQVVDSIVPVAKSDFVKNPGSDVWRMDVFSAAAGWTPFPSPDPRFTQRYQIQNGITIFCETCAVFNTSPAKLLVSLQGQWTWWKGGKQTNWKRLPGGYTAYDLSPAGTPVPEIHETMSPPQNFPNGVIRVRIDFSGQATGIAYMQLTPQAGGKTQLCGRFAGVQKHLPGFTTLMFTQKHLEAERGTLSFPLPKGTGWLGLYQIFS